ncbi:MAG: hypothetical protein MUF53_02020 [Gemmatimonadaceae bacterium]|nr:hypothetical protein [Gemmatimonadaceae bacterium]
MYSLVLTLHSLVRWLVVGLAALGIARGLAGKDTPWSAADETARRWLPHAFTLQLLLGLALYGGLSPSTKLAMGNMGAAMKDPALRFWAVEHLTVMILALALAHIGGARTRRAADVAAKRRTMLTFFGLATVLVLWAIPWKSRPMLRLGGTPDAPMAPAAPAAPEMPVPPAPPAPPAP